MLYLHDANIKSHHAFYVLYIYSRSFCFFSLCQRVSKSHLSRLADFSGNAPTKSASLEVWWTLAIKTQPVCWLTGTLVSNGRIVNVTCAFMTSQNGCCQKGLGCSQVKRCMFFSFVSVSQKSIKSWKKYEGKDFNFRCEKVFIISIAC